MFLGLHYKPQKSVIQKGTYYLLLCSLKILDYLEKYVLVMSKKVPSLKNCPTAAVFGDVAQGTGESW